MKLRRAKFQRFSAKGTFLDWGMNGGKKFNGKLRISGRRK